MFRHPVCYNLVNRLVVAGLSSRVSQYSTASEPFHHVKVEQKNRTVWVTLNRPTIHNAFNEDLIAELTRAFREICRTTDDRVQPVVGHPTEAMPRAVVLTAEGKSFSAGADLNWMKKMVSYSREQNMEDAQKLYEMFHAIRVCPIPVVGRINGSALGGGTGLISACDFSLTIDKSVSLDKNTKNLVDR